MPNGIGLTRYDLDKDFPDNPVMVGHVSMHGAVLNSAAMKKYNITAKTKTPAGGIILRKAGTNEPTGLLMETAYLPIYSALPQPTKDEEVEWSRKGQMLYAAAGITTAQEGLTHASDIALIQRAAAAGVHVVDVVSYPFILDLDAVLKNKPADFTAPYLAGGSGGHKNWPCDPSFPEGQVKEWFKKGYVLGFPLNVHA